MKKLAVEHIVKSYGKKEVLRDLSFTAQAGQCVGILGENGSGKSTLFSVLTGLQKGQGAFRLDDCDLMRDVRRRREAVGFVPQSPPLLNELSALDNLRLWYTPTAMEQALNHGCLKLLGVDSFLRVPVNQMSGGMKKRLAIGCAMAHDPEILLLDEPTASLDLLCKENIYGYLATFCGQGGVALLATHDVYELQQCDVLYLLRDGKLKRYDGERTPAALMGCLSHE